MPRNNPKPRKVEDPPLGVDLLEAWLRQAVEAGHAGGWGEKYPRKVWYRDQDGETIYEAREGSPGSGEYHGYPQYT